MTRHPAFLLGIAQVGFESILNATTLDDAKAIARQARHDIDRPVRNSDAAVARGRTYGPVGEEQLQFQGLVAAELQAIRAESSRASGGWVTDPGEFLNGGWR